MATKKQQQAFYEDALESAISMGAKNTNTGKLCSSYAIETKAGKLNIHFEEPEKSKVFSIFCHFEDVSKAKAVLGKSERLNQYSGKWNFHTYNATELLFQFESELKPIL